MCFEPKEWLKEKKGKKDGKNEAPKAFYYMELQYIMWCNMTQAVVNLDEYADRVLNVVKALYGFRKKDEAVNYVIAEYGEEMLERSVRPEYLKKLERIRETKPIKVKDFAKEFDIDAE